MPSHCDPEARKRYHREYMRRRYHEDAAHRRKQKARAACRKAVVAGLLMKGQCEVCGRQEVEAHHDDYDQPLRVRWFCRSCHEDRHGGPGCHG